jgi:NAD(P)H dehydrogenase (quinone)
MNDRKIAITMASGRLGSSIINELKKHIPLKNIVGLARTPEKAKALEVEIRKADYNQKQDFLNALEGIDTLLLISGVDDPNTRILQNRNIIDAATQKGVKKIVYTSVIGPTQGTSFSPVVNSNRQTEKDIKNSGLDWVIGRNGVYIEADLEYVKNYTQEGGIINCAENGKCGYTSRQELAVAYTQILLNPKLSNKTYNLTGQPITQSQLAKAINIAFKTDLEFKSISIENYTQQRQEALGNHLGGVIAGIYAGIRCGAYDVKSDFMEVTERNHKSPEEMIGEFLASSKT